MVYLSHVRTFLPIMFSIEHSAIKEYDERRQRYPFAMIEQGDEVIIIDASNVSKIA